MMVQGPTMAQDDEMTVDKVVRVSYLGYITTVYQLSLENYVSIPGDEHFRTSQSTHFSL